MQAMLIKTEFTCLPCALITMASFSGSWSIAHSLCPDIQNASSLMPMTHLQEIGDQNGTGF